MRIIRTLALIGALMGAIGLSATSARAGSAATWLPSWYVAPAPSASDGVATDMTFRQTLRLSTGGTQVRLRFSNAYGTTPLTLDDIRVTRSLGQAIDPSINRPVTFNGKAEVEIAPGAWVLSDPVDLVTADGEDLAVSFHLPGTAPLLTVHDMQRGRLSKGDGRRSDSIEFPETTTDLKIGGSLPWLAGIDVSGSDETGVVIAFGDSITDGYGIAPASHETWPDLLSDRLDQAGLPLGVINSGISGNRLLHHGTWARFGEAGLARLDRDLLAQPNAKAVIVLIGINDFGHAGPGHPEEATAQDIIDGLSQVAARAHEHGLKVYVATLTPFRDTVFENYFSEAKETGRQAVNAWIRSTPMIDGVFDFDRALEDPARPGYLLPAYDLGDHLHPNAAGMKAMVAAIPVTAFDWAR
jgi:lysophospholipase L1-like esterase